MKRTILLTITWITVVWSVSFCIASTNFRGKDLHPQSKNPLERWDAAFYRSFAEHTSIARRDAFFPTYGYMIGGVMKLFSISFGTAALVTNSLITLATLITIASAKRTTGPPSRSLTLSFLAMPAAFSLLAPYPTAFIVLGAVLAWEAHHRRQYVLSITICSLAFFFHPTAIALVVACLLSPLHRPKKTLLAQLAVLVVAASMFLASGMYTRFTEARIGFTTFEGVSFLQQGRWYLTHFDSSLAGLASISSIIFVSVLTLISVRNLWEQERWLTLTTLGLAAVGIGTGLWTGLPRFLLPALALPMVLEKFPKKMYFSLLVLSFVLQSIWLYCFITWQHYV